MLTHRTSARDPAGGRHVDCPRHALHLLGSRILGFSQDLFDDTPDTRVPPEALAAWSVTHPRVAELAVAVSHEGALGGCDDDEEFAFALDVLLDALERRRVAETAAGANTGPEPALQPSTPGDRTQPRTS